MDHIRRVFRARGRRRGIVRFFLSSLPLIRMCFCKRSLSIFQQTDTCVYTPSYRPCEPYERQGYACAWHADIGSYRVSCSPHPHGMIILQRCGFTHFLSSCVAGTRHRGMTLSRSSTQSSKCTNISDSTHTLPARPPSAPPFYFKNYCLEHCVFLAYF